MTPEESELTVSIIDKLKALEQRLMHRSKLAGPGPMADIYAGDADIVRAAIDALTEQPHGFMPGEEPIQIGGVADELERNERE